MYTVLDKYCSGFLEGNYKLVVLSWFIKYSKSGPAQTVPAGLPEPPLQLYEYTYDTM